MYQYLFFKDLFQLSQKITFKKKKQEILKNQLM